jgi:hypothetical protein
MSLRRTLVCLLIVSSASAIDCHRNRDASEGSGVNNARSGSDTGYTGTGTYDSGATGAPYDTSAPGTPGTTGTGGTGGTGGTTGTGGTGSPGSGGMVNDAGMMDAGISDAGFSDGSIGGGRDAGAVSDGGTRGRIGRDAGG